jgi:hypothetical protein
MDWRIRTSWILATLALLPACGDDGSADATSGPTTHGPASGSDSNSGSGSDSNSGSGSDSISTGEPGPTTTADDGTSTGTDEGSTTGEVELCNGWSERGPAMPWLELYDRSHQPLAPGGSLTLECGGQGSWMLPIFPEMGGWQLPEPYLTFSVEVVVEGFAGPFGSFYAAPEYVYGLECFNGGDESEGFLHDCIAVLPPDDIADLAALDGAPATVHVELEVDGGEPLVMDLANMTISAPPEVVALRCGFG